MPCKNSVYEAKFKTFIKEKPGVPREQEPKLYSSDGITDPKIREVYGVDIQDKIVANKKQIHKALRNELEGKKNREDG
jgi:hypothetical protein